MNHHSFLIKQALGSPPDREESKQMLKSVLLSSGLGVAGSMLGYGPGILLGGSVGDLLNKLGRNYNFRPLSAFVGSNLGLLGGNVGGVYLAHRLMREKKNEPGQVA